MRAYRITWITFISTVLCVACTGQSGVGPSEEAESAPNMSARRYSILMRLASQETECPKQELSYSYLEDNRHGLTGCGRSAEFMLICFGTQCRWTPPPIAQASFDLNCAVEDLGLVPIHDQKVGIKGCGRRSSYGWICQSVLNCDWYRDGTDGTVSDAANAASKAGRIRAIEASNQTKRKTRSIEEGRRQLGNRSTAQNGIAGAAAAAGGR